MPLIVIILLSLVILIPAYFIVGRYLSKQLKINNQTKTPAHTLKNDSDFVPASEFYLLSQHLSAIAAAGPIVGPILAGLWFGWLPTFIWIIVGGIFIGGIHDFVSIVASIRNQGRSIGEVIRESMSKKAFILFLLFLWFSLIYIIAAFTDVTASTFVEPTHGAQIASSSMLYLLLAFILGIIIKIWNPPLSIISAIGLPLVIVCIMLGPVIPLNLPAFIANNPKTTWNMTLLIYCFFAAIMPVWLLLQPRGYLGGFFLTLTAGVSFLGLLIGSFTEHYIIQFPAFSSWTNPQGLPIFPLLFITVACGACSGFHCLIASGTTSKQLNKESDALTVGYGGMLIESFVAITALGTLMILTSNQAQELKDPSQIYANGIATFLHALGINKDFALNFALLAFATFVYDTLDVATRLGRYILEELTGWKTKWSPYVATFVTLILPFIFLNQTITDASGHVIPSWKYFWTVFGSSNQLLAAIVLFGLSLWMFKSGLKHTLTLYPSLFMMGIALFSLSLIIQPWLSKIMEGQFTFDLIAITCLFLFSLTAFLLWEGITILRRGR